MPGFDRTGPEGKGAKTGRGLGKCNPQNEKNDANIASEELERGMGRGLRRIGLGRGKGRRFGRGNG